MENYSTRASILEDQLMFALEVIAQNYMQLTKEDEDIIKQIANRFEYVPS